MTLLIKTHRSKETMTWCLRKKVMELAERILIKKKTVLVKLVLFMSALDVPNTSARICSSVYDYEEALQCCRLEGSSIISMYNLTDAKQVEQEMAEIKLRSTWLPLKRLHFEEVKIIDIYNIGLATSAYRNQSCGVLDIKTGDVMAAYCSQQLGYICQVEDCTSCIKFGWLSARCHQSQQSCYLYYCDHVNWYRARLRCRQINSSLAMVSSKPSGIALSLFHSTCQKLWIGRGNVEWVLDTNKGQGRVPVVSMWGVNEPSDRGDCAAMFFTGMSYKWKAVDCNSHRHVICEHRYSQAVNSVVSICLGVIGGYLLAATAVVIAVKLYRRKVPRHVTRNDARFLSRTQPDRRRGQHYAVRQGHHRYTSTRAEVTIDTSHVITVEEGHQIYGGTADIKDSSENREENIHKQQVHVEEVKESNQEKELLAIKDNPKSEVDAGTGVQEIEDQEEHEYMADNSGEETVDTQHLSPVKDTKALWEV